MSESASLQTTPLNALHLELGAKMVAFAGYSMPVNYPGGILAEHRHCREAAALFDVSHMGQIRLVGDDAARAVESLMPMDIIDLPVGRQRYGLLTLPNGGILDDLMVSRRLHDVLLVVNAAGKQADLRHLVAHIGHRCQVLPEFDRGLLALQGPKAVAALSRLNDGVAGLSFMSGGTFELAGLECFVTRSGYTGEDGFEIAVPGDGAEKLARRLLAQPEVKPAGLGARDTLRLEAGLCLYGHDIDDNRTPIEAGLGWALPKVRRPGGARAGHYPGAPVIEGQLATGVQIKRVGLIGLERVPVREGATIHDAKGHKLGHVTSGTLAPTIGAPIAMAYLAANHALPNHEVYADVRGRPQAMKVTSMPFIAPRYHR